MNRNVLILSVALGLGAVAGAAVWLMPARAGESRAPAKPAAANPTAVVTPPPAATTSSAAAPTVPAAARIEASQIQNRWVRWVSAPVRDPFRILLPEAARALTPESPISRFQLLATWLQTGGRLAVIDRQIYGEGDTLAEYRVVSIRADAVVVQGRERREEITFTSYVPGATGEGTKRTNLIEQWLGPEKEKVY